MALKVTVHDGQSVSPPAMVRVVATPVVPSESARLQMQRQYREEIVLGSDLALCAFE